MARVLGPGGHPEPPVVQEVRTERLVIVGSEGRELAVIAADKGVIQVRIGGTSAGLPCCITLYAGEDDDNGYIAGVELSANGDSIGGCALTLTRDQTDFQRFG